MADTHSSRLIRWQKTHGRHDLPWQNTRDPYRVWLSEIMLQQTQVSTVLGYFSRFLEHFPTVAALAAAPLDDVFGLWSGLGYYSRAHNLHRCALDVMHLHDGRFPQTAAQLQTLPGIGRSTAGAIAALCFSERVAILDANAKRVVTRVLGFEPDLATASSQRLLWDEAASLLPVTNLRQDMPRYTQAIMDLGATVCTPRKPACEVCPLESSCAAKRLATPERFPVHTRKLRRSSQSIWLLWAQAADGSVWLGKRPTPGVWAGLYCFALFESRALLAGALQSRYRDALDDLPSFTHVLTHRDLHLHPVRVELAPSAPAGAGLDGRWVASDEWPRLGLPAPVRALLARPSTARRVPDAA